MTQVPPTMREPMADHNRRLSLGMEPEDFAREAGVTVQELKAYEMSTHDLGFDLDVANRVGAALDRLEVNPPPSQLVRN